VPLPITSLYAAITAVLVIGLMLNVSMHRARTGISINHGEDQRLALAIRQHGNAVENAALALLLLLLCEAQAMPALWLHILGVLFVVSRLAHVFGLHAVKPLTPLRLFGTLGTQAMMLAAAAFLIWTQF
jgi:uncharacterized protein